MKLKKFDIIFYSACFVIALMPLLLSQESFIGISFSDTGQIGDTIGGITAPFVGLLGALLVYKSFKAQIEANKTLSKETTYNYVNSLVGNVIKYSEEHKYQTKIYEFLNSFEELFQSDLNSKNRELIENIKKLNNEINFVLKEIDHTYREHVELRDHNNRRIASILDSGWIKMVQDNKKIINDFNMRNARTLDRNRELLFFLLLDIEKILDKLRLLMISKSQQEIFFS